MGYLNVIMHIAGGATWGQWVAAVPRIGERVEIGDSEEGGGSYVVVNVVTYTDDSKIQVILDEPRV